MEYTIGKTSGNSQAFTNCVYVKTKSLGYIKINTDTKECIFKVLEDINLEKEQISLNTYQRTWLNLAIGTKVKVNSISVGLTKPISAITLVAKNLLPKQNPCIEITDEIVEEKIKKELLGLPIYKDLQIVGLEGKLNLIPIEIESNEDNSNNTQCLIINSDTKIKLISTDKTIEIETSDTKELFKGDFNFLEMGIGGLDKQFEIIFRRAFSSRLIPDKILKNLGINHVRGLMLYGPAGTGKTLIARQIGKILNCEEPKVVNGPSLLSSYIGKSEENVRALFADAQADKNGKKLHLIILDEFDSLGRKRGTSGPDAGVADKIVNQFLSMIDGPESLNNILLIGMTNRLDMIDEALLRPGRFEVQIEISLPDEKGRYDILKIHTNKMNKAGYLDPNTDLVEIASITKNFTGAELESVIKNAVSYCISKELDPSNLSSAKDINPKITQNELIKSALEIKPQFGTIAKEIEIITSVPFELYSIDYNKVYTDILEKISNLSRGNILSILIQGDSYIGKTTMACQIAKNSGYNCVKFVSSENLINFNFKETQLYDLFEQGYRSESFVLVLDCVEKLIEYSKLGNIYNNKILQTIYTILSKIIEPSKSVVVILTSSNKSLMSNIELFNLCTYTYQLMDIANSNTQNKHASVYFREKKFNQKN
jgi:vesicle-fusing ATPase